MPRGYTGPPDPDKGKPYRHTQAKIRLMLGLSGGAYPACEDLLTIIIRVAEKRPDDVLDAVIDVLGEGG